MISDVNTTVVIRNCPPLLMGDFKDLRNNPSALGPGWISVCQNDGVDFEIGHFTRAIENIIRNPNITSKAILRCDIFEESVITGDACIYSKEIPQLAVPKLGLPLRKHLKRRIIPRNPVKDESCIQTSLIFTNEKSICVVYYLHGERENCPFYVPPVRAVAIWCDETQISVHYQPFDNDTIDLSDNGRPFRTSLRLIEISMKHSRGIRDGYKKRVHHDQVVDRAQFQDLYLGLKKKYGSSLMEKWVESTDPKKHVFEDIGIAAFLICLWNSMYSSKDEFDFLDLGCGNGLLTNILVQEGYKGCGIDARERKSWKTYDQNVQSCLKKQAIIPSIAFEEGVTSDIPDQETAQLIRGNTNLNVLEPGENTFLVGNHSDELTLWIPLLQRPFCVIPCCSHSLAGNRTRFASKDPKLPKSGYAGLIDHTRDLASRLGWTVELELLRIPSTRNAALIGRERKDSEISTKDIVLQEGGMDGWVSHAINLMSNEPRNH